MNVRVMTDSGSGLTKAQAEALGMDYLPLQVTAGDSTYLDGIDLTTDRLYDMLEAGDMPSTSLPPLGIVEELAEKYEEEGVTDVVLITLSNGLSSTNSTVTAALKSHDINVHTLDLYTTLGVEWYAAQAAAQLAAAGVAPQEIVIVLPPWMLLGTEILLGVVGAVLVLTLPSSETKREEGSTKAGRMA